MGQDRIGLDRRKFVIAAFVVLGLLLSYNLAFNALVSGTETGDIVEAPTMEMPDSVGSATDLVAVAFQVTSFDTIREYATIEYGAAPVGRYGIYQNQSSYIRTPFSIQLAASGFGRDPGAKGSEIDFAADSYVGGFELPLNLYSCRELGGVHDPAGGSRTYPGDRYCFDVMLQGFGAAQTGDDGITSYDEPPLTWLLQYGSGLDGYRISYARIPYFWDITTGDCYEWAIAAGQPCSIEADATAGYSRVIGMVERSPVVGFFTYVVLGMIVLAAICAVAITLAVAARSRKPTMSSLSFLAGLLFAVQPLRAALPDAPPVGADLDIRLFYPSVLAIISCLAVLAAIWVRRDDAA